MSHSSDVVIVDTYRVSRDPKATDDTYCGLKIHAKKGLHAFVADTVKKHLPVGAKLLDLASGTGALSLRFSDLGYNVTSADIVFENFRLHDKIAFKLINLNLPIPDDLRGLFDAVAGVEIIEHLENPRKFLRDCALLLKPGGICFLTTPNVDSSISKAMFVRNGVFKWFQDFNYHEDGHITPIPLFLFHNIVKENAFSIVSLDTYSYPPESEGLITKLMAKLICIVAKNRKLDGEILVAVLRKEI